MEIEIIRTQSNEEMSLESTKYFGIILSKSLSIIHMIHWYSTDFNVHEILGSLYSDLDDLFDKLQEEIIGTSKSQKILFPGFHPEIFNLEDTEQYPSDTAALLDLYNETAIKIVAIINSRELDVYIKSVISGLNNTKEDILSRINKTNYLLSMIQVPKTVDQY